jgi:hypothetical protein
MRFLYAMEVFPTNSDGCRYQTTNFVELTLRIFDEQSAISVARQIDSYFVGRPARP